MSTIERRAVVFANYPGDLTQTFDFSKSYGPNTLGENLWPVDANYNAETKTTRVGFSYMPPKEQVSGV